MKKITLFLAMSVFGTFMFAQGTMVTPGKSLAAKPFIHNTQASKKMIQPVNVATTESFWLNYGEACDALYNTATGNWNYLCNDSVWAKFGTTYDNVWVCNLFDLLDVKSQMWKYKYTGMAWNKFTTYTVDSMGITYAYARTNPSLTVVDTLIVKYYANVVNSAATFPVYYFSGTNMQSSYGVDTLRYAQSLYNGPNNGPSAGTATVYTTKVPLTIADTSVNGAVKVFKLSGAGINVAANQLMACSFNFKPGAAYTTNVDTMGGKKVNQFLFESLEEQGASSFPLFNGCNKYLTNCDFNVSYIATNRERYGVGAWSGGGKVIPAWAYTAPYGFEHHQIFYKATSSNVGMNEVAATGGIELGQNMPNPANGNTLIDYALQNGANVSFEIYDITGKKVMTVNEGHQVAGDHTIELNASALKNGVYFYTLKAGEFSVTKKMTVVQ